MQPPLLVELPDIRRSPHGGNAAASAVDEQPHHEHGHHEPRLALYASRHGRSGRPRFVGPAPKPTWGERLRNRLNRLLGRDQSP